jgi:hypothetical protein
MAEELLCYLYHTEVKVDVYEYPLRNRLTYFEALDKFNEVCKFSGLCL